jgi:hypothetical protein
MLHFSVMQMAQKHGWQGSSVWLQPVVNTNDFDRFQALQWESRTAPGRPEVSSQDRKGLPG